MCAGEVTGCHPVHSGRDGWGGGGRQRAVIALKRIPRGNPPPPPIAMKMQRGSGLEHRAEIGFRGAACVSITFQIPIQRLLGIHLGLMSALCDTRSPLSLV